MNYIDYCKNHKDQLTEYKFDSNGKPIQQTIGVLKLANSQSQYVVFNTRRGRGELDSKYINIVSEYDGGLNIRELSIRYGTSYQNVYNILKIRGCQFRSKNQFKIADTCANIVSI